MRRVLCPTGIAPGRQGQVPVAGDELLLRAAAYILRTGAEAYHPKTLPAMAQTAGLEPAHTSWRGALPTELRLHIPGIRRGQEERKDGKNEDADITQYPHSRTSVRQHSSIWRNLKYLFSVQLRASLALIPAKLVKADVVIRSNQFQLRQPRFPCASLIPSQCVPAQPHQFGCYIPADNRVSAFSEPLQPFRECTHITTSHSYLP